MTALTNHYPPPPWASSISDEAHTAPSGRTFGRETQDARVYHLLAEARRRQYRWPISQTDLKGEPGAVPSPVIDQPWAGGQRGGRCCRELRKQGVPIEGPLPAEFNFRGVRSKLSFWRLGSDLPALQSTIGNDTQPVPASLQIAAPISTGPLAGRGIELVLCEDGRPLEELAALAGRATTADDYKELLRKAYRAGTLQDQLVGTLRLSITADTVQRIGVDPTLTLTTVLPKLGVKVRMEDS